MKTHLVKTMCSSFVCETPLLDGMPCTAEGLKSEMFYDAHGYYWCKDHEHRGRLLNWGAHHGYPAIRFTGSIYYLIGEIDGDDNRDLWNMAILVGSEDMIWSALSAVLEIDGDERSVAS
jgi:hypothetical protein